MVTIQSSSGNALLLTCNITADSWGQTYVLPSQVASFIDRTSIGLLVLFFNIFRLEITGQYDGSKAYAFGIDVLGNLNF